MNQDLDALRRGDCAGRRELSLARAGLDDVPQEIFGLAETLEVLDLSGNALTALPAEFGRLRKLRVLFCSANRFDVLPPVLGDCPALSQIGCRGSGLRDVPAESLPPLVRWLTLTDNRLMTLPSSIGERPALQKLMLAGNRLTHLPASLAGAPALELLRLAANQLDALPPWLMELPRLAWLAWAGNPFDVGGASADSPGIAWQDLQLGPLLGEGASGWVHQAVWRPDGGAGQEVALKLFKGAMTSDGLPEWEMAACLTAGAHPTLMSALGRLDGHPERQGLAMPLLPPGWRPLAGPPSPQSCSRDVYDPALRLDRAAVLRISGAIGSAAAHLHARGIMHGDLYAHNILWDGKSGDAVLTDFGAASLLPPGEPGDRLKPIEIRAWGLLLGELLECCGDAASALWALQRCCVGLDPKERPSLAEAVASLAELG